MCLIHCPRQTLPRHSAVSGSVKRSCYVDSPAVRYGTTVDMYLGPILSTRPQQYQRTMGIRSTVRSMLSQACYIHICAFRRRRKVTRRRWFDLEATSALLWVAWTLSTPTSCHVPLTICREENRHLTMSPIPDSRSCLPLAPTLTLSPRSQT